MLNRFSDRHATFDDPVSLLLACHERVRHYLSLLQKLAVHLHKQGVDAQAQDAAKAVLRYFDIAAPLHHQDEDDDLFTQLQPRADAQLQATIALLQAEHSQLHAQWAVLREVLLHVAAGQPATLDSDSVAAFASQYAAHAAREETDVYPHAAVLLNAAELQIMGQRMAARRTVT